MKRSEFDDADVTRVRRDRSNLVTANTSEAETQPAVPSAAVNTGDTVGAYRVLRLLGTGGMGEVYEAEQIEGGRRVALKVLARSLGTPDAAKRFLREGRLAASVTHPNSVYVFGSDDVDGVATIAMELVDGGTLADLVKREGPLRPTRAVDAILQMAAGLEAAAAVGVLHRDIKPSNCFVDTSGAVKIGDYGLSMSTMAAPTDTQLTMVGTFIGTPAYASPEQVSAGDVDVRSDIYSVGATLYFLLTGKPPFAKGSTMQVLGAVLREAPPSPRVLATAVPEALAAVVLRCLAKQPQARFATYADLRAALLPFSSQPLEAGSLAMRWVAYLVDAVILMPVQLPLGFFLRGNALSLVERLTDVVYFGIAEGVWGASVGKRVCGLRVVAARGGAAGIPRAVARVGALGFAATIPLLVRLVYQRASRGAQLSIFTSGSTFKLQFDLLPLLLLFVSARTRNGLRGLHEFVSGTRVVRALAEARVDVAADAHATREAIQETVGRYACHERLWSADGQALLAGRDETLGRAVWIHRVAPGTPRLSVERQNIARRTRLRVIDSVRHDGEAFDVYEAPDGAPLAAGATWAAVRQWLPDLVTELAIAVGEGTMPAVVASDRLWATSDGSIRLLDFSLAGAASDGPRVGDLASAQDVLTRILASVLNRASALPLTAGEFVEKLRTAGFQSFEGLHAAALRAAKSEGTIPPPRRLLVVGPVAAVLAFIMAVLFVAQYKIRVNPSLEMLDGLLSRVTILEGQLNVAQMKRDAQGAADVARRRDALLVYAGDRFDAVIADPHTWSGPINLTLRTRAQRARQMALAASADSRHASAAIVDDIVRDVRQRMTRRRTPVVDLALFVGGFGSALVAVMGILGILLAAACRAPVSVRLVGGALITADGHRSSRGRAALRSIVAWSPVLIVLAIDFLSRNRPGSDLVRGIGGAIGLFVTGAAGGAGLMAERFSLPDRLARTRIVPR